LNQLEQVAGDALDIVEFLVDMGGSGWEAFLSDFMDDVVDGEIDFMEETATVLSSFRLGFCL
jgi:hypothetical protein